MGLIQSINIVGPEHINGVITISANEKIQKVTLYDLRGNCIDSINGKDSSIIIPTSAFNIVKPGIYIVNVETLNGATSKKIFIK